VTNPQAFLPFGQKFEMRFPVRGLLGTRPVLAVWMHEQEKAREDFSRRIIAPPSIGKVYQIS